MKNTKAPADVAYEALRRAIIERAVEPGTKLPEDALAAQFGISRTPVRAVLARLQAEGLVAGGGRRTAAVAEPGLGEARQVFEVRRALEREVVRLVAQRWTPAFAKRLQKIVQEEQSAHEAGDLRASSRLAGDFHTALAEMADNFLLARFMSEAVSRCSLILAVHAGPHSNECSIREHEDIIRSFGTSKVEEVMAAMDAHIAEIARQALKPQDALESHEGLTGVLAKYAQAVRGESLASPAENGPGDAVDGGARPRGRGKSARSPGPRDSADGA